MSDGSTGNYSFYNADIVLPSPQPRPRTAAGMKSASQRKSSDDDTPRRGSAELFIPHPPVPMASTPRSASPHSGTTGGTAGSASSSSSHSGSERGRRHKEQTPHSVHVNETPTTVMPDSSTKRISGGDLDHTPLHFKPALAPILQSTMTHCIKLRGLNPADISTPIVAPGSALKSVPTRLQPLEMGRLTIVTGDLLAAKIEPAADLKLDNSDVESEADTSTYVSMHADAKQTEALDAALKVYRDKPSGMDSHRPSDRSRTKDADSSLPSSSQDSTGIIDGKRKDHNVIESYERYLSKKYSNELGMNDGGNAEEEANDNSDSDEYDDSSEYSLTSISSGITDDEVDDDDCVTVANDDAGKRRSEDDRIKLLYSMPVKSPKPPPTTTTVGDGQPFNSLLLTSANLADLTTCSRDSAGYLRPSYAAGSLPDLRSIDDCRIARVSHVEKNESEADSEPGTTFKLKFRPLPGIPPRNAPSLSESDTSSERLYETIDNNNRPITQGPRSPHKSFKGAAMAVSLVPKLSTNNVRSRTHDLTLSDISQYLPDRKLTIFIGTWNMKGSKTFPDSLDDFLLPPESTFLQDIYVIGAQEGTPFRHEWQVHLQEALGPSHVLVQSSKFGVLQLQLFVRRELVWFCTNVETDTCATRIGHKIKTKGAIAMSLSIFGTSFLFITSHFTSHEGKMQDRINDYNSIIRNINLPLGGSEDELKDDVTLRFDRVFWSGDFNFRVKKKRPSVDALLTKYLRQPSVLIQTLLKYDQLLDALEKRSIFNEFLEAPITFMPTYKFDVGSTAYDTSSKQRTPSWTDRILSKSKPTGHLKSNCYNSCEAIKTSDHRPVYGMFETTIEPLTDRFAVPTAQFDRNVYVEANLRRAAPTGTLQNSHVCTIL